MKRMMMGISIALASIFTIVGCSEEISKPVQQEEISQEEKMDFVQYAHESTDIVEALQATSDQFNLLAEEVVNNPQNLHSNEWKYNSVLNLQSLNFDVTRLNNIDFVPTVAEEAHTHLMLAANRYQFVIQNYPAAIDNMDSELLEECLYNMKEGHIQIEMYSTKLGQLADQHMERMD